MGRHISETCAICSLLKVFWCHTYQHVELLGVWCSLREAASLQGDILNAAVDDAAFELDVRCNATDFARRLFGPHDT